MLPPSLWPTAAATIYRTFGARGIRLRAMHELRRATARFRPAPRHDEVDLAPPASHPFRVDPAALGAAVSGVRAGARADRVVAGEFQAYRCDWRRLPSGARAWLRHPETGQQMDASAPWWKVAHLDPAFGDIKDLWEPARFAWAYDLVRGWLLTGDDRHAAAFHERLRDWGESSRPFLGPHWSCGQETSIRAVALLYCEANLADAPSSTPEAMARITRTLAASGERVADALGYAVSQRNNHAISEAAGLVVLGVRFRGRHPEADRWLSRGTTWLERLVREQFAPDGWYIQHSFTYARLALDMLVVAERALRSIGRSLSDDAVERLRAAHELLLAVLDGPAGEVPNHGPNDGAFVHPVTAAAYRDFRPVLTATSALWGLPLPADVEPDAETAAWLGLKIPPPAAPRTDGVWSGRSGWAVARIHGTVAFLRAGRYRSRPGHIDPLHLDVRMGGREIVVDPGTYAYSAPPPWRNALAGGEVHNGPRVDGREHGIRGPRFLWYRWPTATLVSAEYIGPGAGSVIAEIPGLLRREVTVERGRVVVKDHFLGDAGARELSVLWTLHPDAPPGWVRSAAAEEPRKGDEGKVVGWFSPCYGRRFPTTFIRLAHSGLEPLVTVMEDPSE